jgi:death-on-curing protein
MKYLNLKDLRYIYATVMKRSGGSFGVRNRGAIVSSLAQPRMTFNDRELYPTLAEKAAALCYSLISNHPFIDGNKRVSHAVMIAFLKRNGYNLIANVNEQERVILKLAKGEMERAELTDWIQQHIVPRQ